MLHRQGKRGIPRHEYLSFELGQPEECRLLSFLLRLPSASTTDHLNSESEDKNAIDEEQQGTQEGDSTSSQVEADNMAQPFLHLGRLRIYGQVLDEELRFKLGQRENKAKRLSVRPVAESDPVEVASSPKDSFDDFSSSLRSENSASSADLQAKRTTLLGLPLCTYSASPLLHGFPLTPLVTVSYGREASATSQAGSSSTPPMSPTAASSASSMASFLASLPSPLSSTFTSPQPTSVLPRDLPLTGKERALYDHIMSTPSLRVPQPCCFGPRGDADMYFTVVRQTYNQITPVWSQYRNGKQMIDICIDTGNVSGFVALVRHGEEGVLSQVNLN